MQETQHDETRGVVGFTKDGEPLISEEERERRAIEQIRARMAASPAYAHGIRNAIREAQAKARRENDPHKAERMSAAEEKRARRAERNKTLASRANTI